jgi:hypothetical protein
MRDTVLFFSSGPAQSATTALSASKNALLYVPIVEPTLYHAPESPWHVSSASLCCLADGPAPPPPPPPPTTPPPYYDGSRMPFSNTRVAYKPSAISNGGFSVFWLPLSEPQVQSRARRSPRQSTRLVLEPMDALRTVVCLVDALAPSVHVLYSSSWTPHGQPSYLVHPLSAPSPFPIRTGRVQVADWPEGAPPPFPNLVRGGYTLRPVHGLSASCP